MHLNEEQRKLAEANHDLIYWFMHKYNLCSPNAIEDWYGVCAIGLCKAAMMFDETRGATFSTFASKCMFTEMRSSLRKKRINEIHFDPYLWNVYIDEPDADFAQDSDEYIDIKNLYLDILEKLTPKQKAVIIDIFEHDYSQLEVANKRSISRQRVNMIYNDFIKKLRKAYYEGNA